MSIFGRLFGKMEQKVSSTGSIVSERLLGRAVWSGRDFEAFALEAYQINPIGYRAVRMIATAASTIPIIARNEAGDEIDDHPFLKLLKKPNPTRGQVSFLEAFYSFLILSGNGYMEAVGPAGKEPVELWTQRSDRIKIIPGKFGLPHRYEYMVGGQTVKWAVNQVSGESRLLHVKEFHPTDDWYGLSRIEAAARGINQHNAASEHNQALLQNGGVTSGILSFKPIIVAGSAKSPDQTLIDAAQKKLEENHTGPKNAGKPMVLSGDVDWKEMGQSQKDMDFLNGKTDSARDALIAIGVPPILVLPGESTYNNRREAMLELYEQNVLPLVNMVLTDMSTWAGQFYEEKPILAADIDKISALEPRRELKRDSIAKLLDKNVITTNEAREELDYEPHDKDTIHHVDTQLLAALISAVETVGLAPLVKYMRSVNLIDENKTDEQILSDALALIESDPDEDDDGNNTDDQE